MVEDLRRKSCKPCEGGAFPLTKSQAETYLYDLGEWELSPDARKIARTFVMRNFASAVRLVDRVADLAEQEGHHPDLHLTGYRKLVIELSTHAIGGLSENDFILAAKIEALPKELREKK